MTRRLLAGRLTLALWQWVQGRASAGDVAVVMTSYFVVNGYLREVGAHVRDLQQAVNELEDLVLFQRRVPKIVERLGAVPLQPTGGRIEMERVTFTYGNQRKPLYADFSLAIAAGERVALVGPSGRGQSTFVTLAPRLYAPDAGRILIASKDTAGETLARLRRGHALGAPETLGW